jgi:hypothetical protein
MERTMIVYHLRLQPDVRAIRSGAQPLSTDVLQQLIQGAIVHQINGGDLGYPAEIEFQLEQDPNDALLNTILIALERCGYTVADGEITSWIDGQTQGFIYGLGVGAGAGAFTKNPMLIAASGIVGAFAGHLAGGKLQKHEVIYQIRRPHLGARAQLVALNNAAVPKITLADWLALADPNPEVA